MAAGAGGQRVPPVPPRKQVTNPLLVSIRTAARVGISADKATLPAAYPAVSPVSPPPKTADEAAALKERRQANFRKWRLKQKAKNAGDAADGDGNGSSALSVSDVVARLAAEAKAGAKPVLEPRVRSSSRV